MNRKSFKRTIVLAAVMVASSAFADPQLAKCIDHNGHVLLTDEPCRNDVIPLYEEVEMPATVSTEIPTPTGVRPTATAATERVVTVLRESAWARMPQQAARRVSTDMATLQTARTAMQLSDSATRQMQNRLAGN